MGSMQSKRQEPSFRPWEIICEASVDLQRETVKSLTRKIHPLPQEVARKFVSTESLSRRQLTLPPTPPIFNHKLASNVDLEFKFIPTVWSRNPQAGPAISFVGPVHSENVRPLIQHLLRISRQ